MRYKNKKYNRVCYVTTIYALLLYLLHSSYEEIQNTLFIFANAIPNEILRNFPINIDLDENKWKGVVARKTNRKNLGWILGLVVKAKLPKITRKDKIYAQDHLLFAPQLIGNKNYTLIEDSSLICSKVENNPKDILNQYYMTEKWYYPLIQLLYGRIKYRWLGKNNQCRELLVTKYDSAEYLKDKKQIVINLFDEWKKADKQKKDFILNIYNITSDETEVLNNKKIILFTQPLDLGANYQIELYKKIVSKYDPNNLVIKVHPTDFIPYERFFPKVMVYRNKIPSQLLDIIGVRFERAVTLFSSAVENFSYSIAVDWYGTDIDQKLYNKYGDVPSPHNAVKCNL